MDDPKDAAQSAGLSYVGDDEKGLRRERAGDSLRYLKANGDAVTDEATLERIRKLAIPPAWTDVWICAKAGGHLQATGRDARGRKQYRYHAQFREVRESTKYEHMLEFARALPAIRAKLSEHMARRGLPREKVLATIVHLLESTLIRIGNDDYARRNKSYGLTTLRNPHVSVDGAQLRFRFKGKSGKTWQLQLKNRRVAKIVRACQELPGQKLFEYLDENGEPKEVTSSDVNAYLKEITGSDITAKDFRTWAGTVLAALALREFEQAGTQATTKKNLRAAIEQVAHRLGNTPAICRKCYVHPEVLDAYIEGGLDLKIEDDATVSERAPALKPEEAAVLAFLEKWLARTLGAQLEQSLAHARRRVRRRAARQAASPSAA